MVSWPDLSAQVARPWGGGPTLASPKWRPQWSVSWTFVVRWPNLGQAEMAVSWPDLGGQLVGPWWSGGINLASPKWRSVGPTLVVSYLDLGDQVAQPCWLDTGGQLAAW